MRPTQKKGADTFRNELDALFRENYELMYNAAHGVTGNREDAQDAVQSVFLRLIHGPPEGDFVKNPQGYLRRAAFHEAVSILRLRERRKETGDDVSRLEIPAPEPELRRRDDIEILRAAMSTMKPAQVELLNLRYVEEYSCREIAARTGKRVNTVFVELFRARAELKSKFLQIQEEQREKTEKKPQGDDRTGVPTTSEA
jgi:RNA polymerase sigma-70 factor, ECF subfamily